MGHQALGAWVGGHPQHGTAEGHGVKPKGAPPGLQNTWSVSRMTRAKPIPPWTTLKKAPQCDRFLVSRGMGEKPHRNKYKCQQDEGSGTSPGQAVIRLYKDNPAASADRPWGHLGTLAMPGLLLVAAHPCP